MTYIAALLVLEMLCVNTYTTYACSSKKGPPLRTTLSVIAVTVVITALVGYFYMKTAIPGASGANGKGLFMLFGFLYVIPLKYVFNQSLKQTMIIMSSSWIYTMFTFALSVQIANLITAVPFIQSAFVAQSLIYITTLPMYLKFVNKVFIYIIRNIETSMLNPLLLISLSWFFILFLLNYIFVEGATTGLKFLTLFFLIGNVYLSYKTLFKWINIHNRAETLTTLTITDALTQLKNREGLYSDTQRIIDRNSPFTLLFVDLDDFKSVNDVYGHAVGDAYLIMFSKMAALALGKEAAIYRLHGDEFIIVTGLRETDNVSNVLSKLSFIVEPDGIPFKGLSLGQSSFPSDGDKLSDLLYIADKRMYQQKKKQYCI